jgi:hypothetical protein
MLMNSVDRLLAAESVRRTKATYWYAMDTKDWARLATVFTDDSIFDMRSESVQAIGGPPPRLPPVEESIAHGDLSIAIGGTDIAAFIRRVVEHWVTVHHGAAPIIDIVDADTATAIWPLFDYIEDGGKVLKGYGHYHDRYRRVGDDWLISHCRLSRLRLDGVHPWSTALQDKA